jgi:hypothetical protein
MGSSTKEILFYPFCATIGKVKVRGEFLNHDKTCCRA